jgi:adenine-specific DNA-methyltransferase
MSKVTPKNTPVARTSADPTADRAAQLRTLFPDAFVEGKLDIEKLKVALGEDVFTGTERFQFGWAGRSDSIACLQTPTRATLLPCEEESLSWGTTKNLFIEGDNLEVLKLLYKPYHGKVKLIYIDPPYNTGQDFIYPDDFKDTLANYLKLTKQSDDDGNILRSNPDTSGRYHSDWLSMMYPRLFLARQLLRDDGVIFVSIDDHEVHHLRMLMNEIFGEENFVAQLIWKSRQYTDARAVTGVSTDHEYIVAFARGTEFKFRGAERDESKFSNPDNDPRGDWMSRSILDLADSKARPNLHYPISDPITKNMFSPPEKNGWRYAKDRMEQLIKDGAILFPSAPDGRPREKKFRKDMTGDFVGFPSLIQDVFTAHGTAEIKKLFATQAFDFPKPSSLVKKLVEQASEESDLILDFFSGSGTTAQAVLELNREDGGNRRFILVQLPEPTGNKKFPTIAEIGKERIRRVIANLKNETGNLTRTEPEDLGFKVYKLAESHYKQWSGVEDRTPAAYQKQLRFVIESPLRDGWRAEGLLWEVALKEGFGLNSIIDTVPGLKTTVYKVRDPEKEQQFLACFSDKLPPDITKQLGLGKDDLLVVLDSALDDTLASNLALQCKLKTI